MSWQTKPGIGYEHLISSSYDEEFDLLIMYILFKRVKFSQY